MQTRVRLALAAALFIATVAVAVAATTGQPAIVRIGAVLFAAFVGAIAANLFSRSSAQEILDAVRRDREREAADYALLPEGYDRD